MSRFKSWLLHFLHPSSNLVRIMPFHGINMGSNPIGCIFIIFGVVSKRSKELGCKLNGINLHGFESHLPYQKIMIYTFLTKTNNNQFFFTSLNNYYQIYKRKNKVNKIIVNRSSFKFKKSREQYSLNQTLNFNILNNFSIIPKFFESILNTLIYNTNYYILKLSKKETFKIKKKSITEVFNF